jgi:hypothetical protein
MTPNSIPLLQLWGTLRYMELHSEWRLILYQAPFAGLHSGDDK